MLLSAKIPLDYNIQLPIHLKLFIKLYCSLIANLFPANH